MVEGVDPWTRLRRTAEDDGCLTSTREPDPIEKDCQLTIADLVPCRICIVRAFGVAIPICP